jgi:integrase
MGKLTAISARSLIAKGKPGAHADGGNLYLRIAGPGSGKWTLRYMVEGKAREMGLGSPGSVSLAEARDAAQEARKLLRTGVDPIDRKRTANVTARRHTFAEVAGLYIGSHEAGWRNTKHQAQWPSTLARHVFPSMGTIPVADVDTGAVMKVLEPIWRKTPETASRVRGRVEAVLDYAKARGWREGENPARWRGHLANLLPAPSKISTVEHHPALPWEEVGSFMVALHGRKGTAALALEFAILTAARSGEVRGAKWDEVDMVARAWTVPGTRMKAGREHRVPLSDAALNVLEALKPLRKAGSDLIFPSPKKLRSPLSDMTLTAVLRRMGRPDLTVHGFRSTFRDWAAESTGYAREVAEMALAHAIGDKVEAAYRRRDLLEKRRQLMDDWARFCSEPVAAGNVVQLRAG